MGNLYLVTLETCDLEYEECGTLPVGVFSSLESAKGYVTTPHENIEYEAYLWWKFHIYEVNKFDCHDGLMLVYTYSYEYDDSFTSVTCLTECYKA